MKKAGLLLLLSVVCSALVISANLSNSGKVQDDLQDKIELAKEGGTTRVASRSVFSLQSIEVEPVVEAYNYNNSIHISVQNYRGPVWVEIYSGRGAKHANFDVYDMGFDVISLSGITAGEYNIRITVGSNVYSGIINKGGNGKKK